MDRSAVKVSMISLGCSKNLVDAECMIKDLENKGYTLTNNVEESDVAIINTCGFIDSAKSEAINTILSTAEHKVPDGNIRYLIVSGCLPQRYSTDILTELPEVDAVLGTAHYKDICKVVDSFFEKDETPIKMSVEGVGGLDHLMPERSVSTESYAWLKIGEGCVHRCSFCAIPLIRGKFISRPMEDILEEANILAKQGYKEIILAAQDTTNYGIDLYKKRKTAELLHELGKIEGIETIRVMYGYMDGIEDGLVEEMANNPKVTHYIDIPIQHGSDRILKAMKRRDTAELITNRLEALRSRIPDIIIRTTVMVGFPGETEEDFETLKENLKKWKFDRLGCFIFSPEEGTPAFDMPDQVDDETKQRRYDEIYALQKQFSLESNQKRIGTETVVTIDSVSDDGIFYKGRSYGESPEVDPYIYVAATNEELKIGGRYKVRIVDCSDYEMTGVTV